MSKILTNRAVLGEFQPHRFVDGKRVPDGHAITDYYPRIVDDDIFSRAERSRAQRLHHGAGRKGRYYSNVFSRIAKCAYCGLPMHFENKGPTPKGGTFLVCDAARRGLGCSTTRWAYDEFEASFLAFVRELDLEPLVRGEEDAKKRSELDQAIHALEGRRAALQTKRERIFDLIEDGAATKFVASKLEECERELATVEEQLRARSDERSAIVTEAAGFYDGKEQLRSLIERLQRGGTDEVYKLRAQVASRLQSVVEELVVAPVGAGPLMIKEGELVLPEPLSELASSALPAGFIEDMTKGASSPRARRRYFEVIFKNGAIRRVYPREDDPLQFEEQFHYDGTDGAFIRP